MADNINDLISKIDSLIDVLSTKQDNNIDDRQRQPKDSTFTELMGPMEKLRSTIAASIKAHNDYTNAIKEVRTPGSGEGLSADFSTAFQDFKNELQKINNEFAKMGVDSKEHIDISDEYIEGYFETLSEGQKLQAQINAKKLDQLKFDQEIYNLKLEQDLQEINFKKETIESQKEVYQAEIDARKELMEEEIKARKELNKYLANPKYQKAQKMEDIGKDIEKKWEATGKAWGTNKNGKKNSFAELGASISKTFGKVEKMFKTESGGRIVGHAAAGIANAAAGGAKLLQSGKMDVSGMADKASQALSNAGPYGAAAAGVIQILKVAFEMYSKVDKAASDYARSVGGGHAAQVKMRNSAAELATEMSKLGKTAYVADEILSRMAEASQAIGRNLEGMSVDSLRSLQDLKNFGIDDATIAQFDTFGISAHNASKQLAELYGDAGKSGLNAKATIKAFTSNLKMAQNYTFARGRKALADMALKSAQLKFNLRDAEQFANKVSTLEGAMNAGAQLSVLGGNFAIQGNPLAMMYNALNDVEGLQNQMLAMTQDMARWDSSKGQFEITAFDRERLKAMSQATGIDYTELTAQAMNQARVDRVSQQIGGGFSKDEETYIKNLAEIDEHGNAMIRVGKKQYSMQDIRDNKDDVRSQLKAESEAKDTKEGADLGDVWSSTRSIQDKLDDFIKYFQTKFANMIMKIVAKLTGGDEYETKYGIEGEDADRYRKLKKVLDDKHVSQEDINALDDISKKILQSKNIINEYGMINRSVLEGLRHKNNQTLSWGYTAKMYNDYRMANPMDAEEKKANGGFISGPGGPKDDVIPAKLSNGEFVVNAEATRHFRPMLEDMNEGRIGRFNDGGPVIKNGKNTMKNTRVIGRYTQSSGTVSSSNNASSNTHHSIKIDFGTLTLNIGDVSQVIDKNRLANILLSNSTFVDNIIKNIGIRGNFGYRKEESQNKFLDTPFWG